MYKLWGLLPVICRLPNDSGFDHKQVSILKIAKINVTLVHYILCRIYWSTTFRGPTETTTITVTGSDETSPGTREYRTWWVVLMYCILTKELPWVEHLTSLPRRGVGVVLSVSAFNHERAPMSCLQQFDALEANNYNVQWNNQHLEVES